MTTKKRASQTKKKRTQWPQKLFFGAILLAILLFSFPQMQHMAARLMAQWRTPFSQEIAPFFTPYVHYWGDSIRDWATTYQLDPNLIATVMQIESCGHPTVVSHAGAQGLFQVMPFHFATGEVYLDPATNAMRSANFLHECTRYANGDVGLTLACYNGGPSVTKRPIHTWPNETQRYHLWGTTIYMDAQQQLNESLSLNNWLNAGGRSLCSRAAQELGLP